jgi:hypothetical protein
MNLARSRPLFATLTACLLLLLGGAGTAFAASTSAPVDAATQKRIDGKSDRLLAALKLEEAARVERVRGILADWLVTLWSWHEKHDPELTTLWTEWNKARAVVPKDEFPGEVIAHRIDDVYASLKPAYEAFLGRLSAELTPEQIDRLKETWSRSPGMQRTYEAYLQIVPDLTPAQQEVIRNRMLLAREAAMLTDSDKEIVNIYKVHKVKVEAYVGTLQWAKLHSAYANRAKAAAPQR